MRTVPSGRVSCSRHLEFALLFHGFAQKQDGVLLQQFIPGLFEIAGFEIGMELGLAIHKFESHNAVDGIDGDDIAGIEGPGKLVVFRNLRHAAQADGPQGLPQYIDIPDGDLYLGKMRHSGTSYHLILYYSYIIGQFD